MSHLHIIQANGKTYLCDDKGNQIDVSRVPRAMVELLVANQNQTPIVGK